MDVHLNPRGLPGSFWWDNEERGCYGILLLLWTGIKLLILFSRGWVI